MYVCTQKLDRGREPDPKGVPGQEEKDTGMRTNIVIKDELLEEAARLTGIRTKRELVDTALRLLVETRKRRSVSELKGELRFYDGFDHRALRKDSQ